MVSWIHLQSSLPCGTSIERDSDSGLPRKGSRKGGNRPLDESQDVLVDGNPCWAEGEMESVTGLRPRVRKEEPFPGETNSRPEFRHSALFVSRPVGLDPGHGVEKWTLHTD